MILRQNFISDRAHRMCLGCYTVRISIHAEKQLMNTRMSTVTFIVSGYWFEISCKCLEGEPSQRLPLMVKEAKKYGKPLMFNIDRPAERFAAIVAYYQTGELHIPAGVCPAAF